MTAPKTTSPDPFQAARQQDGVMQCPFHGETITMILRHGDLREAAKDWKTFSSDAPFRVPIPSEEEVRTMRQLPIETDPPLHTEYRAIAEPYFQRPKSPEMIAKIDALIDSMVDEALAKDEVEVVGEFALPLQSRALTHLLNMPESEADVWIDWGIHVFKVTGGEFKTGNVLEEYLHAQLDRAEKEPGADFFSALVQAEFQGRKLTREECMGFGNLTFAGGRDTIIHSVSSVLGHLGWKPEALEFLREDPKRITLASEEFFRVFMPLTQIGRVCPADTEVRGVTVKAGERVGLCWASANHDETVFDEPEEIRLNRKPNPHVSFGFGEHLCLGAPHARLIVRTLLQKLCDKVRRIEVLEAVENVEREEKFTRAVGFEKLRVRLVAR
ncbi:MAG: cytochrome P450 [Verrucomicrobiales bacterium]|nr:cytochrome P450 [Verrucomicrobiales bacterium]